MKKNKIYILLLLFPIIDLITAMQTRFQHSITIGTIIKGLFLLYTVFYIIFLSTSKYRRKSLFLIAIYLAYLIGYFLFKIDILDANFIYTEINYISKFLFLPLTFIFLINYYSEHEFDKKLFEKTMLVLLFEYTILLMIPKAFNISYSTYAFGLNGDVGLYYSANELSVIFGLLLPFIYTILNNKNRFSFLASLPVIYIISSIGTKVSMICLLGVTIFGFIFLVIKNKFKINNYTKGSFLILIFSLLFIFVIKPVTISNTNYLQENTEEFLFVEEPLIESHNNKVMEKLNSLLHIFLSNRDAYFIQIKDIYNKSFGVNYLLFGMGYSNTSRVNNEFIEKTIEIDFLDLFFHQGIIGLILELLPLIYVFVILIKYLINKKENLCFIFYHSIIIAMVMAASSFAGHVLMYPAVSIYLALYLIYLLSVNKTFEKESIKNNKIIILGLHLKHGGIERVLTSQANMLANDYEVEIVSLYNNHATIPYDLNKNIKVRYLMNTISNRDKINEYKKKKDYINLIKEIFIAIKILISKKYLLKKEIIYSDAKVIISTRKEFSKLLKYYARENVVTIGEEHNYHNNNEKYIKSVIKSNNDLDYFFPASKELCDFYRPKIKATTEYISNSIRYIPKQMNKLENKKIVAIGRLSQEKGYKDLIEVMQLVNIEDKDITLDIYGDGIEKQELEKLIKEKKLENIVKLKGFINEKELNKVLKNYSLIACTSFTESFGLSVLEASSFGIPCIYFDDAKGIQEFLTDKNSIKINDRDITKMAKQIIQLFNKQDKLKVYGKNCKDICLDYSFDSVKEKLIKLVKKAIKDNDEKKKILFISSTGGHLNELLQLKPLIVKNDSIIVTEKDKTNQNLITKYPKRVKYLVYGTKKDKVKYFCYILPFNCFKSLFIYLKSKPEYIITTGAHTAGPMCCIGKIFGSKIVYIETFANITSKTATGRIIYHFADLFIVQWEEMLKEYPNAVYWGWVF